MILHKAACSFSSYLLHILVVLITEFLCHQKTKGGGWGDEWLPCFQQCPKHPSQHHRLTQPRRLQHWQLGSMLFVALPPIAFGRPEGARQSYFVWVLGERGRNLSSNGGVGRVFLYGPGGGRGCRMVFTYPVLAICS